MILQYYKQGDVLHFVFLILGKQYKEHSSICSDKNHTAEELVKNFCMQPEKVYITQNELTVTESLHVNVIPPYLDALNPSFAVVPFDIHIDLCVSNKAE